MSEELAFALYTGALVLIVKLAVLASGYLSIRMGYQLISAGAEGKFRFKAEWKGVKADLASVSPGLLFVLLGCWLCAYAIYVDKPIHFERSPAVASTPGKLKGTTGAISDMPGLSPLSIPKSTDGVER